MNYTSQSSVDGRHAAQDTHQRVLNQQKVYNSASEALDAYIAAYEKRSSLYTRRPSDLLAPKPKFYFMDALERSLLSDPGKSPGQKVDDLVAWVNQTYNQNVKSNVQPFGGSSKPFVESGRSSSSRETRSRSSQASYYSSPMRRSDMDELSSLPSASSSIVDLDSNAGTVETDVLLSSFKGAKPEDKYSRSNIYSPPKTRSPVAYKPSSQSPQRSRDNFEYKQPSQSPQRSRDNFEYPSWVSHLGKEYPSWVEDLDNTALSKRSSRSPQPKFTSTGKSYSDSNFNKMDQHFTKGLDELRMSDLQRSPIKSQKPKSHVSRMKDSCKEWTDTMSMDTDILVSQPIYGQRPINMGGDLHKTLYEDEKVNRIKKESTKKLRKSSEKSRSRARERTNRSREHRHSRSPVSSRSKSVTYTPEHITQPPSPRGYHSVPPKSREDLDRDSSPGRYKDYSPLRSGDHSRSPNRLELRPTQFSMSFKGPTFQSTQIQPREDQTPLRSQLKYTSPVVVQSHSKSQNYDRNHTRESRNRTPSSRTQHSVKQSSRKPRDSQEAGESSDTDREMRKSPTGIKMERMYREPTSMYPWKTMIESRNHKSVAFSDEYDSTPIKQGYEPKPALRNEEMSIKHLHDAEYSKTTGPKEYGTKRVTHYFPNRSPGLQNTPPQPIFTSTQRTPTTHGKPPVAPRSSQKERKHKRSHTMPDLRKNGSKSRHGKSRRSYDDDMLSIVTSDTEVLVTQPSMPIVDVSPSLTTVSDSSDTIVGSDTESERVPVGRKGHSTVSPKPHKNDVTMGSATERRENDKFSPTSVFASSSPYAAVREELPKRYHLWKLDEDTSAPDSFIRKKHVPGDKSNIISSFLEDCLNIDDESYDHNRNKIQSSSYRSQSRLSGREVAPGPKEALKNMLFTMQDMAHIEDDTPRSIDTRRVHFKNRIPADDLDSINDDQSDTSSQLFHGEESLQRAYHHLQRLKRLVGNEDDQSSQASDI